MLAILEPSLKKRSLRSLRVYGCPRLGFNSPEWLVSHGENLEELEIRYNSTVTNEVLEKVTKFKKLRYLGVSYSGISDTGLVNVVNGFAGRA